MIASENILEITYLIATALFVLSLKWLSSPVTARRGVWAGEVGMLLAVAGTLLHKGIVDYRWIAVGLVLGTIIGVLFATAEIASGFGSLFAGRAVRLGDPLRTMLSGTVLSILLIAMTPLLGGIFALLLLSQGIRGWLEGVIQPVILSVQARAVGRHQQGAVVGLRQTGQRLTSIVIPPLMGAIADRWGVSESFFVLGALMLLLCVPLALLTRRAVRSASQSKAAPTLADDTASAKLP